MHFDILLKLNFGQVVNDLWVLSTAQFKTQYLDKKGYLLIKKC